LNLKVLQLLQIQQFLHSDELLLRFAYLFLAPKAST